MSWWSYLFSFRGRINRAKAWLFQLIIFGVELVYLALQMALLGPDPFPDDDSWSPLSNPLQLIFLILCVAITIPLFWAFLAIQIKRLHDRNRSAMWFLNFFVFPLLPIVMFVGIVQASGADPNNSLTNDALIGVFSIAAIFQMWGYVEIYFLPGTAGDNRYGPDPLAPRG